MCKCATTSLYREVMPLGIVIVPLDATCSGICQSGKGGAGKGLCANVPPKLSQGGHATDNYSSSMCHLMLPVVAFVRVAKEEQGKAYVQMYHHQLTQGGYATDNSSSMCHLMPSVVAFARVAMEEQEKAYVQMCHQSSHREVMPLGIVVACAT